jgi:FkbM family methyltransferase
VTATPAPTSRQLPDVWQLLHDVMPEDAAQTSPDTLVHAVLAGASPDASVVALGAAAGACATSGGRPAVKVVEVPVWPPLRHVGIPCADGSVDVVVLVDVLEVVDDPRALVADIARVLRPGGVVVGGVAQIARPAAGARRALSVMGLRLLLEEHGLAVDVVKPGVDGPTAAMDSLHGRTPEAGAGSAAESAQNADIDAWGRDTGRRPALVALRKVLNTSVIAFQAHRSGQPTEWYTRVRDIGSPTPAPVRPAAAARPQRAPASLRTFDLRLPSSRGGPPGLRPGSPLSLAFDAPPELYFPRVLERHGLAGFEPETVATVLALASQRRRGWFYDVGANVGVFAHVVAALARRPAVAFEPTPALVRTLRRVADINGLAVEAEEVALGSADGTANFYLSKTSDASNSLSSSWRDAKEVLTVQVTTLDGYVRRSSRVPGVLKIDTETTEPEVLRGGLGVIERHRPWIVCEVLRAEAAAEITELLSGLGYTYFLVTPGPDGEQPHGRVGHTTDPDRRNWLLAPKLPSERFWERRARWYAALLAAR